MKVMHKSVSPVIEEVKYTVDDGRIYLFVRGTWGIVADYEPIPDEQWEDVTEQCEIINCPNPPHGNCENYIQYKGVPIEGNPLYRLVKEQFWKGNFPAPHEKIWAFRVKRKRR